MRSAMRPMLAMYVVLCAPTPAQCSEDLAAVLEAVLQRLERLEQQAGLDVPRPPEPDRDALATTLRRLDGLEQRVEPGQVGRTAATGTPDLEARLDARGLDLRSRDGDFALRLRAGIHVDHRHFDASAALPAENGVLFRRVRPSIEGRLGPRVDFRLTPEFAGDSASLIDGWIDLKLGPQLTLRAGRMKGPVSLERLQSLTTLAMIERGFPSELAPNRDLGLQLQGRPAAGRIEYQLGVFNGTADGRNSPASDPDGLSEVNARLFLQPWKGTAQPWSGLGFGLAGSDGRKRGAGNDVLPRYRSAGQQVFFTYRRGIEADGQHRRLTPQAYWYQGPLGLQAEHSSSRQRLRVATEAGDSQTLQHRAWQWTSSWVLTGEDASFDRVVAPDAPLLAGGGWGAWEIVVRHGALSIDADSFPLYADPDSAARVARSSGLGLNWYPSASLKFSVNRIYTAFDGGAPDGADRPTERALLSRMQLAF